MPLRLPEQDGVRLTCPIRGGSVSYGVRGKRCTKPAETQVPPVIAWKQALTP